MVNKSALAALLMTSAVSAATVKGDTCKVNGVQFWMDDQCTIPWRSALVLTAAKSTEDGFNTIALYATDTCASLEGLNPETAGLGLYMKITCDEDGF